MPAPTRRLLIVEDERLMAAMLGEALTRSGFEVDIAHNALDATELAEASDPDGALIDIHLGSGPTGLHLGQRFSRTRPTMRLIFLSHFGIAEDAVDDCDGLPPRSSFINKDLIHDPNELLTLVDRALSQDAFTVRRQRHGDHPVRTLTMTQRSILRLAAAGHTNQAIAEHVGTSTRNVEQRLAKVYETLGLVIGSDINPRVEAIRQYIQVFGMPPATSTGQEPQ